MKGQRERTNSTNNARSASSEPPSFIRIAAMTVMYGAIATTNFTSVTPVSSA